MLFVMEQARAKCFVPPLDEYIPAAHARHVIDKLTSIKCEPRPDGATLRRAFSLRGTAMERLFSHGRPG